MKHITKKILALLTVCSPFVSYAETLTIESDLKATGALEAKGALSVLNSTNSGIGFFRWMNRSSGELLDEDNKPLANQVIYVEFDDVYVWGAITVIVTGDWHEGKNSGVIRKTFAVSHNPGWSQPNSHGHGANSGEQLELAVGPIATRYKIGSLTHEDSGVLRVPIYKIADSRNDIAITVEGYLSAYSETVSLDPATDISLSAWQVATEDHVAERVALDVETATVNGVVINPLSDYSEIATAGGLYYDIDEQDFKGHNGTDWVSLTSGGSGGTADTASALVIPETETEVLSVSNTGTITLSTHQGDISMGAFGVPAQ